MISSPLPRALQTAEIIAGIIGPGAPETRAFLSLSADPSAMFRRLRDAGDGPVLLVGHMPGLAMLAAAAVGGKAAAEFSKSGACRVDFDGAPAPGRGKLVWLLQPAQGKALRRAWKK